MPESLTPSDILRLRQVMAATGDSSFFGRFRRLMRAKLRMDTFLLMRLTPRAVPDFLGIWLRRDVLRQNALVDYADGFYRLDPFYQFRSVPRDGALYRLADIAPDRFFSSEYYLQYYRDTGLCDEIGLLCPLPGGAMAHLSLSRARTTGPFRRREMRCLRHHAPVLLELLAQHCASTPPPATCVPEIPQSSLPEMIRDQVTQMQDVALTRREAEVAALVMQGHSNRSAALILSVSRETCKVHRRNLYRKLGISSQRDLFGMLKHLL